MDNFKTLREGLKSLINDKTSPEQAELIGKISAQNDINEKEFNELVASKDDLRKKYVEAVKNSSFKEEPTPGVKGDPKSKTFEECIADAQKK